MTLDCPGMAANTPCRPDETLKRCMVCGFVVDTRYAAEVPAKERGPQEITDAQIKHMVGRFLGWRLPQPWHPDNGISYQRPNYAHPPADHDWPTGANLFDGEQAEAMVRYMLDGLHETDFDDSVQCDACGKIVPRDEIAHVVAYGIETNACAKCRGD